MLGLLGLLVFLWGVTSIPKKIIKRKDFHLPRDCWTKGWDFEARLIIRYVAIIIGGLTMCYAILGEEGFVAELCNGVSCPTGSTTAIFLAVILLVWPILLIYVRRNAIYKCKKKRVR